MAASLLHKVPSAAKRLQGLILLLVFILPLGQEGPTNLVLLLLLIQSLLLHQKKHWLKAIKDPLVWLPVIFYALHALSLFGVENLDQGFRQLETKTSFLLAPLFLATGQRLWTKAYKIKLWQALILGVTVAMLWALGNACLRSLETGAFYEVNEFGRRYYFLYTHLASPLMHPGYLATYLGLAILGAIGLFPESTARKKWILSLFLTLSLFFLLLLQARINIIALFFVLGIGALYLAWQRKAYLWLGFPLIPVFTLALFIVFAPSDLQKRYLQWPDFSYDISGDDFNSATYRLAEWKCAVELIQESPWWGFGLGDNREALLRKYEELKFWQGLENKYNAHNQYLETTITTGVIGLLVLFALLGYYLYRAWRQEDLISFAALVFFVVCLLTESMFERAWAVLPFCILFPVLLSGESRPPKQSASSVD